MNISLERPTDAALIEALLDTAFGPKRHSKTVYRLREGVDPIADLSFVAHDADGRLVGTLRFWPVNVGDGIQAILLGPIAVAADLRSQGLGAAMIRHGLDRAKALGHRIVLLVGDAPYYARFGFTREATLALHLPGPVDLSRFLGLELVPGALTGVVGMVGRPADIPAGAGTDGQADADDQGGGMQRGVAQGAAIQGAAIQGPGADLLTFLPDLQAESPALLPTAPARPFAAATLARAVSAQDNGPRTARPPRRGRRLRTALN